MSNEKSEQSQAGELAEVKSSALLDMPSNVLREICEEAVARTKYRFKDPDHWNAKFERNEWIGRQVMARISRNG